MYIYIYIYIYIYVYTHICLLGGLAPSAWLSRFFPETCPGDLARPGPTWSRWTWLVLRRPSGSVVVLCMCAATLRPGIETGLRIMDHFADDGTSGAALAIKPALRHETGHHSPPPICFHAAASLATALRRNWPKAYPFMVVTRPRACLRGYCRRSPGEQARTTQDTSSAQKFTSLGQPGASRISCAVDMRGLFWQFGRCSQGGATSHTRVRINPNLHFKGNHVTGLC